MNAETATQRIQELWAIVERDKTVTGSIRDELKSILALSHKLLCLCQHCEGKGFRLLAAPVGNGFKERKTYGGKTLYQFRCMDCDGKGYRTHMVCCSCGQKFSPPASARAPLIGFENYPKLCDSCYGRLNRTYGLIPDGSIPSVPNLEESSKEKRKK